MTPAEKLEGMTLENGWVVTKKIKRNSAHTGGHFSTAYIVKNSSGSEAFLKALDYSEALSSADPARILQALTEAYNFERDLLEECKVQKMDRIVRSLEFGKLKIGDDPSGVVEYIIFELATTDLRQQYEKLLTFDYAWKFKALHNIAVGIWQLHSAKISHQDLKPSNVLIFEDNISKLGDLGRGAFMGKTPPHESLEIAGDRAYAPPELLYHEIPNDWNKRRFGCDLYLLGSMVVYLFTGLPINAILFENLDRKFHFSEWGDNFRKVLPHLRDAYSKTIENIKCSISLKEFESDIIQLINHLCEVNPDLRGHPRNRIGYNNPYSVERFLSKLDYLRFKAQYTMKN